MPNGTVAPGNVLPPAPPPTGLGELLSSVPMNGLTYWVRDRTAAWAGGAETRSAAATSGAGAQGAGGGTGPGGAAAQAARVRTGGRRRGTDGLPLLYFAGRDRTGRPPR